MDAVCECLSESVCDGVCEGIIREEVVLLNPGLGGLDVTEGVCTLQWTVVVISGQAKCHGSQYRVQPTPPRLCPVPHGSLEMRFHAHGMNSSETVIGGEIVLSRARHLGSNVWEAVRDETAGRRSELHDSWSLGADARCRDQLIVNRRSEASPSAPSKYSRQRPPFRVRTPYHYIRGCITLIAVVVWRRRRP